MGHGGHSVIGRSLYALQLLPWMAAFPANQIKVLELERITGDRQKVS